MNVATLCYCIQGEEVLLGMKKARFGAGKWNGFGGKVAEGESIRQAAVREMKEEAGLEIREDALEEVADILFSFGEQRVFHCHAFRALAWEGEPRESEEMRPQWFNINELPYETMWESDIHWLPQALAGKMVKGTCRFDETGEKVEEFTFV